MVGCGVRWSRWQSVGHGGLGGRAMDFRSRGPGFKTTYCRFET